MARLNKGGKRLFAAIAYVDAQNGFGAVIRTPYMAQIKRIPEQDSWRLIGLKFLN
ncbi:hypothetical protein [uncultured Aliiroseovarius sp.]|uniref:hypothetical protein n=1 Tax=uncultured Aliiroseovarius sp. TaxID=1658783 RepID=UPI00262E0DBE|nr:hypothetical protein [uncultured Aliiroseovarius sp.]